MDKIVSIVSAAPQTRSKNDDDFADRLNSRYTVVVLIVFAIIVTGAAYVGEKYITSFSNLKDSHWQEALSSDTDNLLPRSKIKHSFLHVRKFGP